MEKLLTAEDLAKVFQVTRKTISNWLIRGAIPRPVKIGGVVRWRRSDIEAMLDETIGVADPMAGCDPDESPRDIMLRDFAEKRSEIASAKDEVNQ